MSAKQSGEKKQKPTRKPKETECVAPHPDQVQFIYSFDINQISSDGKPGTGKTPSGRKVKSGPATPDEALEELYNGNQTYARFIKNCKERQGKKFEQVTLTPEEIGYQSTPGETPKQLPFAAVLGCVDARAPVELLFARSFDELYVIRVAGNSLGPDCAGSLHYAIHSFAPLELPKNQTSPDSSKRSKAKSSEEKPLRLVVVLGHKDCGAVTSAVKTHLWKSNYQLSMDSSAYLTNDTVRGVLGRLDIPAVQVALKALPPKADKPIQNDPELYLKALIELAVYLNAAWQAHDAQTLFGGYTINSHKKVQVRYGVFDLDDFLVRSINGYHFVDDSPSGQGPTLKPPASHEEFLGLPPKSLSDLYKLAETMAERMQEQAKTKKGAETLAKHHRL